MSLVENCYHGNAMCSCGVYDDSNLDKVLGMVASTRTTRGKEDKGERMRKKEKWKER